MKTHPQSEATTFFENLYDGVAQSFKVDKILFENRTGAQHLCIFENRFLGRVMTLDGVVQTTEKDEFIYHEMLTHVPLFSHPSPKSVLIIGGGDGGILREVARHKDISAITMVEIDPAVVKMAKTYFPAHSAGAFDDSRLSLHFGDGAEFVQESDEQFDVIISDSTDPIGVGEVLFESKFYQGVRARFRDERAIFVAQNGVPFFQAEEVSRTFVRAKKSFPHVGFYTAPVPTYYGGLMTLAMGVLEEGYLHPSRHTPRKAPFATRFYNEGVHLGAFALPGYIQDLLCE